MSTNRIVKHAIRHALTEQSKKYVRPFNRALLIGAASIWTHAALAQQAPPPADPSVEQRSVNRDDEANTITIVGSRLRHDTFNSPSPVQLIDREETTLAGMSTTTDILQGTGVTSGSAQINNAFGGFVTDGGPGANTISLRGLGAGRTLVLINGRRVAPAGTRGAVGSADLNVLPTAMTEEIQVLRDGASSIYGSDAIAGVINVVTMKNVQGITFEGQYNRPLEGEGERTRFSIIGGLSGDRWNASASLDYFERANLTLGDRDWTKCNIDGLRDPVTGASLDYIDPMTGAPKCYPITSTGSNGVTINTIGTNTVAGVGAPGSVGTTFNRWRPNSGVTTGVVGFEGVGGGTNSLNVRDTFDPRTLDRSLISPAKVITGFVQSTFELQALGDAELYFELLLNERKSQQTGYRQLSLDYPRTTPQNPLIPANLAFSTAFAADQGTSKGLPVGVRAFIGFGNDQSSQIVDFYKPTLGMRGDLKLPFLDDWRYDVALTYSKSNAEYRQQSFLTSKLTEATDVVTAPGTVDPALVRGGLTCRINLTNTAERCIPAPPLNSATIGGNLPVDFRDYIFRDVVGNTEYDETTFAATVDGSAFELPAGTIQALLGVEYRDSKIDDTPDQNSIIGNLYNLTSATPTRGSDNVLEVYTEIEVPILAKMAAAHELTFTGSFRFTEYDSYGSDTTYKAGLTWSPVDWIAIRASKGTSFRAPALFEQYQGATSGFLSQANDPCNNYGVSPNLVRRANCASELPGNPTFVATSGIRVNSEGGAAAGLEAETSDNVALGVVFKPPLGSFGELAIALDYFDIEIDNGVDQAGAVNIMQKCYDDPQFRAGGSFCRLVTRSATTQQLTVSNAYTNIATQIAKGVDYTLRYERDVGPGKMRVNTQLTRYISQANKLFAEDELDEFNGTINTPKWTGNLDLYYTWGSWRFFYGVDWIDAMQSYDFLGVDKATSQFDFEVNAYYKHAASIRYTNDQWQTTVGMRNFTNSEPPTISIGSTYNRIGNAPLYSGYDYVGREAFLYVTRQFK